MTKTKVFTSKEIAYLQYRDLQNQEIQEQEKIENFKERISKFKNVKTLKEAKNLIDKIIPVSRDFNIFRIGNAKCTILNRGDCLKISFETKEEYICYCFI